MIAVFCGPTLPAADRVAAGAGISWHPPAARGDLYRAALARPRAIGLIDGYFGGAPSVWHKEILWAMAQGIPVFGSASMGALRAAELERYGMRGVGAIFLAFRDGDIEDDDEVAVAHGPAALDFATMSEPMVNIRATLASAQQMGVVPASAAAALERLAKSTYFAERQWDTLLQAAAADLDATMLAQLTGWLAEHRVDQKRADALAMIEALQTAAAHMPQREAFEATGFWLGFVESSVPDLGDEAAGVLEELRLLGPEVVAAVEERAAARLPPAPHQPEGDAGRASAGLRQRLGLRTRPELMAWLACQGLDEAGFEMLALREAGFAAAMRHARPGLQHLVVDQAQLEGRYEALAQRSRDKAMQASAGEPPSVVEVLANRFWYFEQRLGLPVPDSFHAYAEQIGFRSLAEFDRALQRERRYSIVFSLAFRYLHFQVSRTGRCRGERPE